MTCLYTSIVCWHILIKQQKNQIRLLFANGKHGNSLVSCDEQQFTQQRIFIFPANSKVHWHNWPKKAMLKGCAEQLKPELSNRPLNCQCKRALLNVKWKACVDAVMCSVLGASSVSPLSSSDCNSRIAHQFQCNKNCLLSPNLYNYNQFATQFHGYRENVKNLRALENASTENC